MPEAPVAAFCRCDGQQNPHTTPRHGSMCLLLRRGTPPTASRVRRSVCRFFGCPTRVGDGGVRREVSLSLKCPVIMSKASLVKQISENVPSVPEFPSHWCRGFSLVITFCASAESTCRSLPPPRQFPVTTTICTYVLSPAFVSITVAG